MVILPREHVVRSSKAWTTVASERYRAQQDKLNEGLEEEYEGDLRIRKIEK